MKDQKDVKEVKAVNQLKVPLQKLKNAYLQGLKKNCQHLLLEPVLHLLKLKFLAVLLSNLLPKFAAPKLMFVIISQSMMPAGQVCAFLTS